MSKTENEDVVNNVMRVDFSKGRTRTKTDVPAPVPVPAPDPGAEVAGATKPLVFKALVADSMVTVRFVTSAPGVVVPESVKRDPVQALNFSHRFGVHDFSFDDERVQASLSFGGVNSLCIVPWSAVFGIIGQKTGEMIMWPASMPTQKAAT